MSQLDVDGIDWAGLRALRAGFLDGTAGHDDYWGSVDLLRSYDRTFGERIGWKWDYVLDELGRRGWRPPLGPVLDWGCGSGVAGRKFLSRFPDVGPLVCSDRSARAEEFARAEATRQGFEVSPDARPATLLVSHVLSELSERSIESLVSVLSGVAALVWVEPGDRDTARALQDIRDRLLGPLSVVAPCTHQNACPLRAEAMERHWCHHFASPPADAFTDPGWGRFTSETGIDLRSTPTSFLVMDRQPVADPGAEAVHVIGRPRVSKPEVRVFGCDASGVNEARITKRRMPERYREAKKGRLDVLARWAVIDGEVVSWTPW
jgi:hypothetical protein